MATTQPDTATDLLATARAVGERLKQDAPERDRLQALPTEQIALLKESGIVSALGAREHGGGGLDWQQALRLVREVSAGDSSLGLLLGYSFVNEALLRVFSLPDQWAALAPQAAAGQWIISGPANPRDPRLELTPDGDGYRLNGYKTFATGASVADRLILLTFFGDELHTLVVPGDRDGITYDRTVWDAFGQRLSETGNAHFDNVHVTAADRIGVPAVPGGELPPFVTLATPVIQSAFLSNYVGTARGALRDAAEYVRTTTRPWVHAVDIDSATEDPYILERFGQLDVELRASELLADHATGGVQRLLEAGVDVTARQRGEVAIDVYAARAHAQRTALEVTSRVFELMGARSSSGRYGFDRRWRDVRVHTLHDPVAYKDREVGDFLLNDAVPEPDAVSAYR